MMSALESGTASAGDPDLQRHLDLCLGCRACEPACPSGVQYGRIIEHAREQINQARSLPQRAARRTVLATITDAKRLRPLLFASGSGARFPSQLQRLLQGDPSEKPSALPLRRPSPAQLPLPAIIPAVGKRRARVGLLTGCVMSVIYGDVNADTAAVLAANGCEVLVNQRQGCCGALHLHNGFADEGKRMARGLIDAFGAVDGLDAIVVNSAGCGSTMKEYGQILEDDPAYAARAVAFGAKSRDFTEFLDDLGCIAPMRSLPITAAYHDACHLAQAQRVTLAPRRLLLNIPDIQLVPLPESEVCCGSAGVYNTTEPEMARRLQVRKVENVRATGADVVVAANPGCMAWIDAGLVSAPGDRSIMPIETLHPATLLRRALIDAG